MTTINARDAFPTIHERILATVDENGSDLEVSWNVEAMFESLTVTGQDPATLTADEFLRLMTAHQIHYATELPCPSWCQYPVGHRFEGRYDDGRQYRFHTLQLDKPTGVDYLAITQEEIRRGDNDEAPVERTPARISLAAGESATGDAELSADEARQIASAMLHAAHKLDALPEGGAR